MNKLTLLSALLFFNTNILASNIIPVGNDNNMLYYKMGGSNSFSLPPVSETDTINLGTDTNLGMGYSCGAFNPAISVVNAMNDLKESSDNLGRDLIGNATGSLIEMPMYELARSNPTLYALFNNQLLSAHKKVEISTKSCQTVKEQISRGENPYQDWGTIAVNDQWKKKLSFVSSGDADINHAKKEIDAHSGDEGVTWVNGNAGGKGQPPVHVIADTVKAGYNAMLNRNLQSDAETNSSELSRYFPKPQSAINWITSVVGDQMVTTCNDENCKRNQGSMVGHGLLPRITSCNQDKENCIGTIRYHLANLVTGNEPINKDNLENVSADGIAISPDAITSIRAMDATQQGIIVNKLAQEVAVQRIINKALIAKNILSTGSQVPVIAANHPAQVIIHHAIENLDNDIRSLAFESQIRKQMMSDTLTQVLSYANQQQRNAMRISPVSSPETLLENGAVKEKAR